MCKCGVWVKRKPAVCYDSKMEGVAAACSRLHSAWGRGPADAGGRRTRGRGGDGGSRSREGTGEGARGVRMGWARGCMRTARGCYCGMAVCVGGRMPFSDPIDPLKRGGLAANPEQYDDTVDCDCEDSDWRGTMGG